MLAAIAAGLVGFPRGGALGDEVQPVGEPADAVDFTEVDPSPDLDIKATFHDSDGSTRVYLPLENVRDPIRFEPGETVDLEAVFDEYTFPPVTGCQWEVDGPDGYHLEAVTATRVWTWVVPSTPGGYRVTLQLILL